MTKPQTVWTVFLASAAIFYGAYYQFDTETGALEFIAQHGGVLVRD